MGKPVIERRVYEIHWGKRRREVFYKGDDAFLTRALSRERDPWWVVNNGTDYHNLRNATLVRFYEEV